VFGHSAITPFLGGYEWVMLQNVSMCVEFVSYWHIYTYTYYLLLLSWILLITITIMRGPGARHPRAKASESCHARCTTSASEGQWVMSRTCLTYECVMSHIWMSHVSYMDESCLTYEWVMSHIWMSHDTQYEPVRRTAFILTYTYTYYLLLVLWLLAIIIYITSGPGARRPRVKAGAGP